MEMGADGFVAMVCIETDEIEVARGVGAGVRTGTQRAAGGRKARRVGSYRAQMAAANVVGDRIVKIL